MKRTLNPVYNPKDATFDFPIYLSLADKLGVLELIIWDKDMLSKDYLGEVSIPLEDWFRDGNAYGFSDPDNKVCRLHSSLKCHDSTPSLLAYQCQYLIHTGEHSVLWHNTGQIGL